MPSGAVSLVERRAKPRPSAPFLIGIALWLALVLVVLLNLAGTLVVDIKPEVYLAPWQSFRSYLSSWQADPQLGFPSFNVGLAPVAAVVGALQWLGASTELSMRLLRITLYSVAAFGAARLFRSLTPTRETRWGALVAAVVYVANPYTLVAGAALGILWPYAILPWLTWAYVRAIEKGTGWRWPAVVGLLFMATTGMNAGVIAALQLVTLPVFGVFAKHRAGTSWSHVAMVTLRCSVMALALSAYWIVPTLSALSAGNVVVENSESFTGISSTSSLAEVLRGLGIWPIYGGDQFGPWVPEHVGYVRHLVPLFASFGFTMLVGLAVVRGRGRLRLAAMLSLTVAAIVMVGLYPPGHETPFGHILSWSFTHVPGFGALRTTNKAGAALLLSASLLVAIAARQWLVRHPRPLARSTAGLVVLGLMLLSVAPAFEGGLFTSPLQLPNYWRAAATDLNEGPESQRVWFVPGEVQAQYRWTRPRPDDLSNSLLSRSTVIRTVIPVTSPPAANFLAAADTQLQEGTMPSHGLSTYAQYLGVRDLLLRNDVVWEGVAGARPAQLQTVIGADQRLVPVRNYGQAGENTVSPQFPPLNDFEAALPPLQHYRVAGAPTVVRTEGESGTVVIAGDGYAVAAAEAAGLLPAGTGFRYASSQEPGQLAEQLGPRQRVLLTDTNRRRTTVAGRLQGGQGPLVAETDDPGSTRALGSAADQTALITDGGRVTATQTGSVFGTIATAAPENAFDHDPATSWQFGDFNTGVGQRVTLHLPRSRPMGPVSVTIADLGPVKISEVVVRAGGVARTVPVDATGVASTSLGGVVAGKLSVEVAKTEGEGFNRVGIAEITVPGIGVQRIARMPLSLQAASAQSATVRRRLTQTPLDVMMSRVHTVPEAVGSDEEPDLRRVFALPDERSFRVYGIVRPDPDVSESDLDQLAGAEGTVRATSTSRAFDLPSVRASMAVDGSPGTAWVPGGRAVGEVLTITAPPRRVRHVDIAQPRAGAGVTVATQAAISLDGKRITVARLHGGTTRVAVPPMRAGRLDIELLERSGTGFVRVEEVDFGGARIPPAQAPNDGCATVAHIDGAPLRVSTVQPITTLDPALVAGCSPVRLGAGTHRVDPEPGWTVDQLVLRDRTGEAVQTPMPKPVVRVASNRTTAVDISVGLARGPYTLVLGQAFDERWRATMDGHDLGAPVLVDGYSAGWDVPSGAPHTFQIRYGPQRAADVAVGFSAVSALGAFVLVAGAPGRRSQAPIVAQPVTSRPPRKSRSVRRGSLIRWATATAVAALLLGWIAGLGVIVLGLVHAVRRPRATTLLWAGFACWCAMPVAWYVGNRVRWGQVTPTLVVDNPWPHVFACAGLVLLLIGVGRQERARALAHSAAMTEDQRDG